MIHRRRYHPTTASHHQCRQKPMHVVESRQLQKNRTIKHFDPATGIRSIIAKNPTADSVRHTRTENSPTRIPPILTMARHHPQTTACVLSQQLIHCRKIRRIVLTVAIKGCYHGPAGSINTRHNGLTLTTTGSMTHHSQLGHRQPQISQHSLSPISAAIINNDHLPRREIRQCHRCFPQQPWQILCLIVGSYHN